MKRKWMPEITSVILYLSFTYAVFFLSARFLIHQQVPVLWTLLLTQFIALLFGLLRIPLLKYEAQHPVSNWTLQSILITLFAMVYIYIFVDRIMTIRDNPSLPYPSVLQLMADMSVGLIMFNTAVVHLIDYINIRRAEAVIS
ncbi:MAG: hypothetical protein ACYDCO_12865 [Armatimonadota bacterium]